MSVACAGTIHSSPFVGHCKAVLFCHLRTATVLPSLRPSFSDNEVHKVDMEQNMRHYPPLQGEGAGGDGFMICFHGMRRDPIPLPASPLKGEESVWSRTGLKSSPLQRCCRRVYASHPSPQTCQRAENAVRHDPILLPA